MELNNIYNMDCMEGMKDFPDKFFELAIVDPPYGIGVNKEKPHNGWKDYGIKEWDNKIPDKNYFDELKRISKNQIIWGGNYYPQYLFTSMGWIFWDKGQRNFSSSELAYTSFNKALRVFDYSRAKCIDKYKFHPTQKPIALYKWILKNYAKPGDKIIDTHVGSGSSIIAFEDAGFEYIGFEIDKDYFNAANHRISEFKKQGKLF